ncbi:MAG: hydantoinase/oxoprolinase family protein [Rhodospirillales bacterium]|jgi:N-methylhydantoinase A|nr:hydantoinase/oxoprolinase family protein [Rhodospirillales bacterium]
MIRIAFDIGGTFTDFVLHDAASGDMRFSKVPSTPGKPADAVLAGIDTLFDQLDIKPEEVEGSLHATTVATNAILERKGNRTALVTTKGFRDILLIARQKRYDTNDLYLEKPIPLVERADILEVGERMAPDGEVLAAVDGADVEAAIQRLRAGNYESIAIVFLHAYANDAHEKAVRDSIRRALPEFEISISSEVSPKFREYERTSTTVANAYVKPLVGHYLGELEGALKTRGFPSDLFIMQSNGGLVPTELARDNPIRIVESGPAAGVLMCAVVGRDEGFDHVMTFDMGGTTAKLGAIDDGEPAIVSTFEVDAVKYKKGSGLPLNISAVELLEIGAGGGSIARTDMGLISVGPESAGADPGPMCYGTGGRRPTITDANLVLGYLNPEYFNGGAMALDPVAAAKGIKEHIAGPLGLSVQEAAWGVHSVANSNMERAMRVVSIERGRDPRDYALVAFGGAGPVHAPRLARAVEIPKLIVPHGAGVGSAVGLLGADSKIDMTMTRIIRLAGGQSAEIAGIFETLETRARRDVARLGAAEEPRWTRGASMRYAGQGFEIRVELPGCEIDRTYEDRAAEAFHEAYERSYGYKDPDGVIEGIDWFLVATVPNGAQAPELGAAAGPAAGGAGGAGGCVVGERKAYFPEGGGMIPCRIVDRYLMSAADRIAGPAVIEERESTTVVLPGDVAALSAAGHLVIEINKGHPA